MKKGISKIPLDMARLKAEDLQEISSTKGNSANIDEFDFSLQMDERENAYMKNFVPNLEIDKEFNNLIQGREKSSTLYAKTRNVEVSLDDF